MKRRPIRWTFCIALAIASSVAAQEPIAPSTWEIAGGIEPGRQPDGNTFVIDAPRGLVVIDTGRHPAHRERIEALARSTARPIVAIVNTHWHLDHVSGNVGLRKAFPQLQVHASPAIDRALDTFLPEGATAARRALDDGRLDAITAEEVRLDLATVEAGAALKPDLVIDHDVTLAIAGRPLRVHVAHDAATAADLWLYDPATRVAFVGDLVTFPAAFLDTACAAGWTAALAAVETEPFTIVAPGHGPLLSRAGFSAYRRAFDALAACSASAETAERCADAWIAAVTTIGALDDVARRQGRAMTTRYITDVLRPNGGNSRYCAVKG